MRRSFENDFLERLKYVFENYTDFYASSESITITKDSVICKGKYLPSVAKEYNFKVDKGTGYLVCKEKVNDVTIKMIFY